MEDSQWEDPNFVFSYNPSSKSGLCWKNPRRWSSLRGQECGTLTKEGFWAVQFKGMPRPVHVILWEMFNYPLEVNDSVLHLDGDSSNNVLENLYIYKGTEKNPQTGALNEQRWGEVFYYKDGQLFWREDRWSGGNLSQRATEKDSPLAFVLDKDGYKRTTLHILKKRKPFRYARIVWELHHGRVEEGFCIDHINGDRTDDRIENLRCVTRCTNARNVKVSLRNTTGVIGVRRNRGVYIAFWRDEHGKQSEKSFNPNIYGEEGAFNLAISYREERIEETNLILAEKGYHPNHGKR